MRNQCTGVIKCSWLLSPLSCVARSSWAGIPHFTSRPFSHPARAPLGPGSGDVTLGRRVGPSQAGEGETPGPVAVTSVSPGPETQLQPRPDCAETRFIVVFWKSVPVYSFPGQSGEDVTQSLQVLVVPVITQILVVNTFKLQIYCSDFLKNQRPLCANLNNEDNRYRFKNRFEKIIIIPFFIIIETFKLINLTVTVCFDDVFPNPKCSETTKELLKYRHHIHILIVVDKKHQKLSH